jgi:hypothetical protein
MKLSDMKCEPFFERARIKLQEGAVETDDAEFNAFLLNRCRKIPRQYSL